MGSQIGIVGLDVCVLPAAFPRAPLSEGMVGWRAEVTAKRGSQMKGTQQILAFGAWFSLSDTERILPIRQLEEGEEEEGEEEEGEEEEGEEHQESEEDEGEGSSKRQRRVLDSSDDDG